MNKGNGPKKQAVKLGMLALTASMLLSVVNGCSSSNVEADTNNDSSKPFKFSYARPTWGPATYTKGGEYEKELFKKANVDIDVRIISVMDYDTTIKTTVASGDMPDVIWGLGPIDSFWKDVQDQGGFLKINEYLDRYPAVKEAVPNGIWEKMKDENGDIYLIPNLIYPVVPFFINYRADIFEELGIAEPKTIQEFEAALETVKNSGLGIVPLTHGNTSLTWAAKDIATSLGSVAGWVPSPDNPDELLPSEMQDAHINFIFWLQDLKKRGLLDEEVGVNPDSSFGETKFKSGRAAVMLGHYPNTTELAKAVPNAKIKIMGPLVGPNGEQGGTRVVFPQDRGFYINAKSKDKAEGIFKFLNWTLTEGSELRRYGIEGKTYEVDAAGRKVPIPDDQRENPYKLSQIEPLKFIDPMSEKLDWEAKELEFIGLGMQDQFDYYKQKFEQYTAITYYDYKDPMVKSPTQSGIGPQIWEDYMGKVDGSILTDFKVTKDAWIQARQKWLDAGGRKIHEEINALQKDKSKPNYLE